MPALLPSPAAEPHTYCVEPVCFLSGAVRRPSTRLPTSCACAGWRFQ